MHQLRLQAALNRLQHARHLAGRFFGSLHPGGPNAAEELWVASQLTAGERDVWRRMANPDRRHAVGVARRLHATVASPVERPVAAAALLHDCGKVVSGLGTYGRVLATVAAAVGGRDMAGPWSERRGFTRRVGLYLRHPELGADLLSMAGSDPLTVAWARQHHLPAEQWSVPPEVGAALKAADDD